MTLGLIITAAGKGERFGSSDSKVLTLLLGKPVIVHTLEQFCTNNSISHCIITAAPGQELAIESAISKISAPFSIKIITGGQLRQESVQYAVKSLADEVSHVLIHDGARPTVSQDVIASLLSQQLNYDAVIPVISVTDTIKVVDGEGMVLNTLDRHCLRAVQTPQLFLVDVLKRVYEQGYEGEFTDEAMMVERYGVRVKTVVGDVNNIKLTYPTDLERLGFHMGV
jgi:2-C-methyl-D-erythritol 4-phosphate cytidylyltransferase